MKYLFTAFALFLFSGGIFAQRATIAVGDIEYRAQDSRESKRQQAYGRGAREDTRAFVDMITTALVKTNKFSVMERDRMEEILKEQGLTVVGVASGGYAGDGFNLEGVDYILTGAITEYGIKAHAVAFSKFATANESATMSVDIRVLNVNRGEIGFADTVSAEATGGSAFVVEGLASSGKADSGAMLGEVMRLTAQKVTNLIVTNVFPIKIVTVQSSGEVMLNYGNSVLKEGDILTVFSQGEAFVDPDTGEELGREEQLIGKLSVVSAQPRFSKAQVLEGDGVAKGMLARLTGEYLDKKGKTKTKKKKGKLW